MTVYHKSGEQEVLTFAEAAEFLRISERTLATLLEEIPHKTVGRQHRFLRSALCEYLDTTA